MDHKNLNKTPKILFIYTSGRTIRNIKSFPRDFFYGYFGIKNTYKFTDYIELDNTSNYLSLLFIYYKLIDTILLRFFHIGFRTHQLILFKKIFNNYDYIIGTNDSISLGLLKIKKHFNFKYKLIYFNMGLGDNLYDLNQKSKFKFNLILKYLNKFLIYSDKILSCSKPESNFLKSLFKDQSFKFFYTGFGVDIDFWFPVSKPKRNFILFVGSEKRRDIHLAIEIAKICPDKNFIFLTSLIKSKFNLPKNIQLLMGTFKKPKISDIELRNLYGNALCLIMPIYKSALLASGQSATLQAMACNCPVIISNYDGFWDKKKFKNNLNIFFTKNKAINFKKIIEKISKFNLETNESSIRNFIKKNYSTDIYTDLIKKTINFY